ncbi:hypothetical protein AGABI1DRAFT_128521 [Agaricus bisporus var. burnettii JB137-S8]|uniref:Uncharacterized protein n=1 Tax=Agaricus bisporus var. burnettii (strain JB137-S8 / ATCC MYA-4627 / FGSC 10392) TaxID=597362 RepID=K5XVZ0_AGABU|nr:uncharacterized protein AGABI1DRAFT_128521 [Agaricus bisporus var. burnettii JB137-S8]EKM79365.1 hypothetical protein AGABI1DRAFT_128521 [Agaricus bisporus var. burnettii JB137-S8]
MLSRPPTRPPLITPSASPPPRPSSSQNVLPSPSKRQRISSRSSSIRRSVSVADTTVDFPKEREASMARMLDTWSQLAERYSRRLDEDDIVDIRTGEIVKDNGFWKTTRRFNFGEALERDDAEDFVDDESEEEEGIDELDAFEKERSYIEDGFAKDLQQKLLTHADHGVTNDLDEFLEAERRRKDEYGSDVEEDELELPLKHNRGCGSPLSITSDSDVEEGLSDVVDQDASPSRVPGSRWNEQESEDEYDDDDDELDNWDPIEGSKIIPIRDLTSSPQVGVSKSDDKIVEIPASHLKSTSNKQRMPVVQMYTPPPSHSLPNSSDSDHDFSPRLSPADHVLGSSYIPEAKGISLPPSPSKSHSTGTQSIGAQAQAPEIIEISDDESPEHPSRLTKSPSSPPSPSPVRPLVRNRRQSVVPQVVITTLPPRPAQIKRNAPATILNTSNSITSTKRTQKSAASKSSVKPTQSANSMKKVAISGTPSKPPQSAKAANKAAATGASSNSITPANRLKKTTPATTPAKLPKVPKSVQKFSKTSGHAKTKTTVPQTIASGPHPEDDQVASDSTASDSQHRGVSPEAGDQPTIPPSLANRPKEPQASKSPPAKRKGYKRKRSSSVFEVADSAKVEEDLSSPHKAISKGETISYGNYHLRTTLDAVILGRVRSRTAAPRGSSRRSSSRSRHLSDDDNQPSSNEDMSYKRHPPRLPSATVNPRIQPPYTPHTPSRHSETYPPFADTRAQQIITQAMHQLAALFWTPTHPVPANPMYPYPSPHHTYPSVGPNFLHSTPDHPHPYPFTFDPSLSAASLPPSSPEPPSSPLKPRERRKSLVSRSYSRGRRVSFCADEIGDESSGGDESESKHHDDHGARNIPVSSERFSSPSPSTRKDKGKGKEKVDARYVVSSGSERESDENTFEKIRNKSVRVASANALKPRAGRPTKGRPLASGSSDPCSSKKPSKSRKNSGGSKDRS